MPAAGCCEGQRTNSAALDDSAPQIAYGTKLSYLSGCIEHVDGGVLEAVVAPLSAALDQLLAVDITSIGSVELVGLLEQLETARHRFTAVDHRVLAEVDQRGVAGEFTRNSTAELLV